METNLENGCWHRPELPEEDGNKETKKTEENISTLLPKRVRKKVEEEPLKIGKQINECNLKKYISFWYFKKSAFNSYSLIAKPLMKTDFEIIIIIFKR